jgi:hypothetical protein
MNDHEAQRIAAAMHEARPDWPASSVLTLIHRSLIDKPRRDVFVALAWIASEPNSHTPARVLESGPWWRAAGVDGATRTLETAPTGTRCTICGQPQDGQHLGHDYSQPRERDPEAVKSHVAELRGMLASTSPPTERKTLEDMAEANSALHERVEALRAANPGLVAPPMREAEAGVQ